MSATPQHMAALQRANEIRIAAAAVKRRVAALDRFAGEEEVKRLLLDPEPDAELIEVAQLLRSINRWGRDRVKHACKASRVPADQRLGDLTDGQRARLANMVTQPRSEWAICMKQVDQQRTVAA